jgi:hypothetical protein
MAKERTLQVVEKDLRRVRRAEKRIRRDWNSIHRYLAKNGGVEGLPKKGAPVDAVLAECGGKPPKLSTYVGLQREISKSLKICVAELKSLEAEKVALALQVAETKDEYSL